MKDVEKFIVMLCLKQKYFQLYLIALQVHAQIVQANKLKMKETNVQELVEKYLMLYDELPMAYQHLLDSLIYDQ